MEFPQLTVTSNNLADVIRFIEEGNIVALHTTQACRAFHRFKEEPKDLSKIRIIYVDCNSLPGLLATGEWEYYIHQKIKDVIELAASSDLRKKIINQIEIPDKNRIYLSLGH